MARIKQEEQQKQWGVLLGSLDEGKKKVAELREMSETTQFKPDQILEYAEAMKRLRVPVDQIIPKLRMYSDIAAGTGQPIENLIELQRMMNVGEARGRYLLRLMQEGVISKDNVKKLTGYSSLRMIQREASMGLISANKVMGIINNLGAENAGKAAELSDNLGKNTENFWEQLTKTRAAIGEVIEKVFRLNGVLKAGEKFFRWLANAISKMPGWLKFIIAMLGIVLALIGPLILGLAAIGHAIVAVGMMITVMKMPMVIDSIGMIGSLLPKIATGLWGITKPLLAIGGEITAIILAGLAAIFVMRQINVLSKKATRQAESDENYEKSVYKRGGAIYSRFIAT